MFYHSGYYPAGAENDPNAPYNQLDFDAYYEKDVMRIINDEIDSNDENFVEWMANYNAIVEVDDFDAYCKEKSKDKAIRDKYIDFRWDDALELAIEIESNKYQDY